MMINDVKNNRVAVCLRCIAVFAIVLMMIGVNTGCASTTSNKSRVKVIAVAEVCTTNGFVRARRTNFDALTAAGYAAIMVPNVADTNLIASVMDKVDGLVLTGAVKESDRKTRDKFDFMLMQMAIERGLPIVGFCRGHQVINRYFGGKIGLIPGNLDPKVVHKGKVSAYIEDCFHDVNIVPGTRLEKSFGATRCKVNTSHKYHVTELGKGLKVTAKSNDGVIEALEHESLPITGFQFHPERIHALDPSYVRIIRDAIEHPAVNSVR